MKKRYILALIVFAALLVTAIGIGVLNRVFFGGISEAKQNREEPFVVSVSMGNTFSIRDVVDLIGYAPGWVATAGVDVSITRSDNTSAAGVLDYDASKGTFSTPGMGNCLLTLRSALDPKVAVQIAFDVKFRSEDTAKWVEEELKDGYLTAQEIAEIKMLEIGDVETADVRDLANFTHLQAIVLTRDDGMTELKNFESVDEGVSIRVPQDLYEEYLEDQAWAALAPRVYPHNGNGGNMVVLHLDGGTLSGASGQDFYADSIDADGKIHFGDYNVSKTGFVFKGWKIGNEKGELSDRVQKGDYTARENVKAYAVWEENYYGIAYDLNFSGISAKNPSPLTPKYTEKVQLATVSATKKGYTFLGWSTSSTAKEATYKPGETVSGLTAEPNDIVKLYGVWCANSYTIYYYGASTTEPEATQKLAFDQFFTFPKATSKKTGYAFVGWAITPTETVPAYVAGISSVGLVSENGGSLKLYAVWAPVVYEVGFHTADIESGKPSVIKNIKYGETFKMPSTKPTREGYTFLGWTKVRADAEEPQDTLPASGVLAGAEQKNLTEETGSRVIFYPIWKADTFTIKFSANGGTGTISNKKVKFGEEFSISGTANLKKTNYVLAGWALTSSATTVAYNAKELSEEDIAELYEEAGGDGEQILLYAVWKGTYTIEYNANGGSTTPSDQTATIDKSIRLASSITRSGYTFDGWMLGTTKYAAGESVKNLSEIAGATVTLTAAWKPKT